MSISLQDLRAVPLFSEFHDPDLAFLAPAVQVRSYPARAAIFGEGDIAPGIWLVRRGRVRVYRIAPSGREFTLCLARPEQLPCFGMCPLFEGKACPAHAEALDPTEILFIPRDRALALAQQQRVMAQVLARILGNHFRHLAYVSTGLALRCSTPRLVDLLLNYAQEQGRATTRGIELDLDITHELLASLLGTTTQMVAQDLVHLKRSGVVDARGKHIVIVKPDRLAEMGRV